MNAATGPLTVADATRPGRFRCLQEWLAWQETLHPRSVDLGLDRCRAVAGRLGMNRQMLPVVSVAGTNGKGSAVAILESILRAAGFRVGAYTSPHLVRYNERIRIDGQAVTDEVLMAAFARVDSVREPETLTYFEFGTLAAMEIFRCEAVDVALLEVGLGGRLDAVNLFDARVALVTTVDIDHVDWLGEDRNSIGREKAGIFRSARPAVYGDTAPPESVVAHAGSVGAPLHCFGAQYRVDAHEACWHWTTGSHALHDLPYPALTGAFQVRNAAAALMVLKLMEPEFSIPVAAMARGLETAFVEARYQRLEGPVDRILDVAHNVQAAQALAEMLRVGPVPGRTLGVLGMLRDKNCQGVIRAMGSAIDQWYAGGLPGERGMSGGELARALEQAAPGLPVREFADIAKAHDAALREARPGDRLVIFGSFQTAAAILQREQRDAHG